LHIPPSHRLTPDNGVPAARPVPLDDDDAVVPTLRAGGDPHRRTAVPVDRCPHRRWRAVDPLDRMRAERLQQARRAERQARKELDGELQEELRRQTPACHGLDVFTDRVSGDAEQTRMLAGICASCPVAELVSIRSPRPRSPRRDSGPASGPRPGNPDRVKQRRDSAESPQNVRLVSCAPIISHHPEPRNSGDLKQCHHQP